MSGIRIVVLLLLPIALSVTKDSFAQVQPAKTIPEFTFYTTAGQPFTRKNLPVNQKIVFIYFDTTCGHCQEEITAIGNRFSEFKNAAFYLVSIEDPNQIDRFMSSYGKKLKGKKHVTVLRDYYKQFIVKFLPDKYPALFVYGPDKRLIRHFGGPQNLNDIISVVNR